MSTKREIHLEKLNAFEKFHYFRKTAWRAWRNGVQLRSYLPLLFPRQFDGKSDRPHVVYIELSNACNIVCEYCACPLFHNEEQFMRGDVWHSVIENLHARRIDKVIISGGEPTLHPRFIEWMSELNRVPKFLSLITNGQWLSDDISRTLASGIFDLVEFSVDAGDGENYERVRVGASFERFQKNLRRVYELRTQFRSRTLIGIRVMTRPSTIGAERESIRRWKPLCDTIISQRIIKPVGSEFDRDVFYSSSARRGVFPTCRYPLRALQIKADGSVPLCTVRGHASDRMSSTLGNIMQTSIESLWRHSLLMQYQRAHRLRIPRDMPLCEGCTGA